VDEEAFEDEAVVFVDVVVGTGVVFEVVDVVVVATIRTIRGQCTKGFILLLAPSELVGVLCISCV
jgi:hypothetical protein